MTAPSPARARYLPAAARMAGYRKLVAFALVAVCGTVLQALGSFDATIATFLGGSLGLYVGGNVREHAHRAAAARADAAVASDGPQAAPRRPGDPAPFEQVEPADRTEFDPERPAVDRETLVQLLADMMADKLKQKGPQR